MLFLLQIVSFALLIVYLNTYYSLFQVIGSILGVLIFFFIINRRENPEYKIPWLFLVTVIPLFGILFYLLFSNNKASKKAGKMIQKAWDNTAKYQKYNDNIHEIDKYMGDDKGIYHYLHSTSYAKATLHDEVIYYDVGEKMFIAMKEALNKARKFILMEYFIIDPGKMWDEIHEILVRKVKEGVTIKLVYDDIGTMGKLRSGYYKTLRKEGIDAHKFNPFRPIVSNIYNNRDHRKIMVIDGVVAFTGGINLGDEYINENKRLGHWKDTGIRVRGAAVNSFTGLFFLNYDIARGKISEDQEQYYVREPKDYPCDGALIPFGDGPKPFYQEQVGENNFINLINHAKRSVYITTPYLIIDFNLESALRDAAIKGIDVRIITPHIPDKKIVFNVTRSHYASLLEAGVKIYEYTPGFVHAKMMVVDNDAAFIGTINLDYRSLTHHYECGAVLYHNECILDMKKDFEHISTISEEIPKSFKLSWFKRLINSVVNVFQAML